MAYEDVNIPMEGVLEDTENQSQGTPTESTQQTEQTPEASTPSQGATEQQAAPDAPAENWDGSQFSLKYRGSPYVPKTKQELINLAQKGFSYSQSMHQLNQERQQYQQQLANLQRYQQLDQALQGNPQFAQHLQQSIEAWQNQQQGQPGQPGNGQQLPPELVQRLSSVEQTIAQQQAAADDQALQNELQQIRQKYNQHDWDYDEGNGTLEKQLLQFAHQNGITNLDYAYRAMMWDQAQQNAKAEALKQNQQQRQQQTRAGIVSGSAAPPPQPGGYQRGMSYNDIEQRMKAEMSG